MEHYFSKKPKSTKKDRTINYITKDINIVLFTSSSVFSKNKVDKGTDLLIRESRIFNGAKILDLGCGYGVVGVALSKIHPKSKIVMSDINERALTLAKKNLELNKSSAEIVRSDLFDKINGKFDVILCNPPQSAGKKLCIKLIEDSVKYLKKNGILQLVARSKKGGKHLSDIMKENFGNLEILGRKSGYSLYCSTLL